VPRVATRVVTTTAAQYQRDDRAEGHLKAYTDQACRIEDEHDPGGNRADPHRDAQAIDKDRRKDDAVHNEGALGRDRGTRDQKIAGQHDERRRSSDLLVWLAPSRLITDSCLWSLVPAALAGDLRPVIPPHPIECYRVR
jgi:hypothetical protein